MNKTKWITIVSVLMLTAACQKSGSLDVSLTEYHTKSEAALTKLTDSYSAALAGSSGTTRRIIYDPGYRPIQPAGINQSVDIVANQCVALIQGISPTQANYAQAMVTLARCLNRIVSEQNLFFTRLYQLQNSSSQPRWAYALDYPNAVSYSSFSGQSFQQINPYIAKGFAQFDPFATSLGR